ncbi:MAG: fimbrillin family protein [Marinifilaceae bacterium]
MGKYNYFLTLMVALGTVYGCNTTSEVLDNEQDDYLKVNVYSMDIVSRTESTQEIAVIALNAIDNENGYGVGIKGKYSFSGHSSVPIPLLNEIATIYACSPIREISVINKIPYISVPENLITTTKTIKGATNNTISDGDYLYGVQYTPSATDDQGTFEARQPQARNSNNSNDINTTVNLGLKHAFANLCFTIRTKDGSTFVEPAGKVTELKLIKSINIASASTLMALNDGSLTGVTTSKEGYTFTLEQISLSSLSTTTWSALAFPKDFANGKYKIRLILDGKTIESDELDDINWEAGYEYSYIVNVTSTSLTVMPIKVEPWKSGTNTEVDFQ